MIQNFKSVTARRINALHQTQGASVWQRNYYEHIIRDARDLDRIREYIINNPANWESDENHPINSLRGSNQRGSGRPPFAWLRAIARVAPTRATRVIEWNS